MPAEQQAELRRWLLVERITYQEATARLQDRFEIKVGRSTLSEYFQQHCAVEVPAKVPSANAPLLDATIQAGGVTVRITVCATVGATIEHSEGAP